jgi:hypothetical protein
MAESAVEVFVQIAGEDVFAGRLWSHQRRAVESATFTYADDYLRRDGYALDPALPLSAGQHQTRVGHDRGLDAAHGSVRIAGVSPWTVSAAWQTALTSSV